MNYVTYKDSVQKSNNCQFLLVNQVGNEII